MIKYWFYKVGCNVVWCVLFDHFGLSKILKQAMQDEINSKERKSATNGEWKKWERYTFEYTSDKIRKKNRAYRNNTLTKTSRHWKSNVWDYKLSKPTSVGTLGAPGRPGGHWGRGAPPTPTRHGSVTQYSWQITGGSSLIRLNRARARLCNQQDGGSTWYRHSGGLKP